MPTQRLVEALAALFILLMIWLRTRMHYSRGAGALRLEAAGRGYFSGAAGALVLGWLVAPWIGRALWPTAAVTPTVLRVSWFLATYYLFILVHRMVRSRGAQVYSHREGSVGSNDDG